MLPIHIDDKEHRYKSGLSIREKIQGWFRLIFSDPASRNLFMFLLLNFFFAFVELIYGVITNSLGLISDAFHMFFDCTALLAGLAASVIMKWRPNERFSYGYVRAEVLAGFVNGLFLVFIAFFIFSEAVERVMEPPEVKHERLFVVSVLGFIVNLIGIFVFQHGGHGHSHGGGASHGHSHGFKEHGHSHGAEATSNLLLSSANQLMSSRFGGEGSPTPPDHGHSHGDMNGFVSASRVPHGHSHGGHDHSHGGEGGGKSQIMQGVFLHIMADTLGSVGVIISAILMQQFGWMIADPICSMFIATLIGFSVLPLLRDSICILMQRTPRQLDTQLPACYQRVMQLEGVYSVQEPHFWTLCSDVYIGTLKLEVSRKADISSVLRSTHQIFAQIGVNQLYVQIDYTVM